MALALFRDTLFRIALRSPDSGGLPTDLDRVFCESLKVFRRTLALTTGFEAAEAAADVENAAYRTDSMVAVLRRLLTVRLRQCKQSGDARLTDMAMPSVFLIELMMCSTVTGICILKLSGMPKLNWAIPH
jgi:hypothetical protein